MDTSGGTELMFQAKTPLHEVRRMKLSIRYRRDGNGRKASCRICLCGRAGKLALRKSQAEDPIGGNGCVYRTARNSRRDGCAADSPKKAALERFHVGRIETNHIGDATGQNIAENAEAGTQHRFGLKLPRDRSSRLQDREGRRRKHVTETGSNGGVQRLIHVVRDGSEVPAQTSNMLMRIQGIGIQRVSDPEGPCQCLVHLPCVLRIQVEIQEVIRLVRRCGKGFCRRGCDSVNVLRQVGVRHGGDRSLPEVVIIQPQDSGIGSKAEFVRAVAPGQVVVDEKTGSAPSLDPCVVQSTDRGKWRIRAAALQNDWECSERFLKVARTEQAFIPRERRIEIIHEILRKDVRVSCRKGVQRLRGKGVKQRVDGIGVGCLKPGVRLKAKPGRVFLADVVINSSRLDLFVIIARMRDALAIRATVPIVRNCWRASAHIERTT